MCTAISVDIHLFRNERRLGSEEVEHGGGGGGWGEGSGASYGGRSEIFWSSTGEGVRTFPSVIMKNVSAFLEGGGGGGGGGCTPNFQFSYNFRLFFLQLKDIHKNNYSWISDNFLSNLLIK